MNPPQNQRRRGRSRSAGSGPDDARGSASADLADRTDPAGSQDSDPLAELRTALEELDAGAFAACFAADGWIRVPRPEGDVVFQGRAEIAQAGYELRAGLGELIWTPSQRFLSAGQVVEEAVVRARPAGPREAIGDGDPAALRQAQETRVSMRAVSALDPTGRIGSLTLWIDWAALEDPLGVQSARGAASALVAHARAQDARGLRVIKSGPQTSSLPLQAIREPLVSVSRSVRPPASVLWWRRHRRTVAGSVMALLTVAVLAWAAQNVLHAPADPNPSQATAGGTLANPAGTTAGALGSGAAGGQSGQAGRSGPAGKSGQAAQTGQAGKATPGATAGSDVPVITTEKPSTKPTVQAGPQVTFQSDVLFKTDSTDLSATARTLLKNLADQVQTQGLHGTIQINGYTDSRGSDAYNVRLSRDRATAVAVALQGYLTGQAVGLMPQGFGKSHPIKSNATAAGQALNRRVTIVLPKS